MDVPQGAQNSVVNHRFSDAKSILSNGGSVVKDRTRCVSFSIRYLFQPTRSIQFDRCLWRFLVDPFAHSSPPISNIDFRNQFSPMPSSRACHTPRSISGPKSINNQRRRQSSIDGLITRRRFVILAGNL